MIIAEGAEWLARIVRGGVFESLHRGHVVVADDEGAVVAALGNPRALTFVRSAIKPLQAAAVLGVVREHGGDLTPSALAIASASHIGAATQQRQVRALLDAADVGEDALQCPPTHPEDDAALVAQGGARTRVSHNCSGKHAAFLLAQCLSGHDPATYLRPDNLVQRRVHDELAHATGEAPLGPAVDGCGAPAWRCSLTGLATAFARIASGRADYGPVRHAMSAHPELIGGPDTIDTRLLRASPDIVAKRGAEAVFAAGWNDDGRPLGVAVKILDGGDRAAGVVAASVLAGLGAPVPDDLLSPMRLADDRGGAAVEVTGPVRELVTADVLG